jgi:hypothetical protein
MASDSKKQWTDPKVQVFGNVETLTLGVNKSPGVGDAFTFEGATTKISS